jgi:hypothetical protein
MKDLSLLPGVAAVCLVAAMSPADERRVPARVYTDEDLARVSSRRGETGVESKPGNPPPGAKAEAKADSSAAADARGESYWRAEAARVRQRVDPWRDDAAELRVELASRQAEPGVRPYTDPRVRALQRKIAALEARIRDAEDRLEERARRARALPGWLR